MVSRASRPPGAGGFTLIELLVVMAIISLLVAIVLPRYFGSLERAREAALREDLATMRDAIDKYYADHGRYPDALAELASARYLRAIPVDPITDNAASWTVAPPPPDSADAGQVYDVHSGAPGNGRDGTPFASW
jgi:general secretion pathway protein G